MPTNKPLKVIIDTNLWISFIISNKQQQIDQYLFSNSIRLLFSDELIMEIKQTISKPKLKRYFGSGALDNMLTAFDPYIDFVDVESTVNECRDPNDNFLLALAKDGHADYLLTGDLDLLDIKKVGKTKITTMASFLEQMKKGR